MAVSRTLLAAALLTGGTAAALAGCTPADSRPTVAAASAAAVADEDADDVLDDQDDQADLAGDDDESAESYSPAAAQAACTAPATSPGHQILVVVSAGPAELTAQPARYTCDPGRYTPTGTPVHYGFAAAGVTATVIDRTHGDQAKPVPPAELITHLNDCLAERDPADPFGCHGNAYDVVLDSHGRIMRIGEVAAP
ncbi:hypothetical protein [Streptomyces sp. NRRL S-350]|uniref:hypothetical protein n=1 Tax=Streptomyces sp. NRRL S-350 TaxID=1463902 RepID=UPI0004BED735|nr:hypothetical protein [Streptomyces sp. NRRL S-350]